MVPEPRNIFHLQALLIAHAKCLKIQPFVYMPKGESASGNWWVFCMQRSYTTQPDSSCSSCLVIPGAPWIWDLIARCTTILRFIDPVFSASVALRNERCPFPACTRGGTQAWVGFLELSPSLACSIVLAWYQHFIVSGDIGASVICFGILAYSSCRCCWGCLNLQP